ncbi:MAG: peptidoglycan-binding protein [Thermoleophilaceae bacterium]
MTARRVAILAVPAIAVSAVAVVIATGIDGGGAGNGARAAGAGSRGRTAVVARRTLVDRKSVDGTLGFAGKRSATNRLSGTITWLPHVGQVIRPGHTLFRVDGDPVVLMDGTLPAYRTLKPGVDNGADVRQLERGLRALGYYPGVVDSHYTASSAAAVRKWQDDLGLDKTGQVELGRVVFLPGARRVTDVKTSLGSAASASSADASAGDGMRFASYSGTGGTPATPTDTTPTPTQTTPTETTPTPTQTTPTETTPTPTTPTPTTPTPTTPKPAKDGTGSGNGNGNGNASGNGDGSGDGNSPATEVLTTSSTRRVVTAKLDAADQLLVARGQRVRVELPDGRFVSGRITSVGRVATADSSSGRDPNADTAPKITVTIRLRSARAAGRLDQAPVSVQLARTTRRNVLAVPVQALVARRSGRYAVELADGRLVGVVPGLFANGYVELTGGRLRAGDRVRVPE